MNKGIFINISDNGATCIHNIHTLHHKVKHFNLKKLTNLKKKTIFIKNFKKTILIYQNKTNFPPLKNEKTS